MSPRNHPEPNLGLKLLYNAGEEKMALFHFGVGESNCNILSFIICVLTQKWYHIKAQILNFNIKQQITNPCIIREDMA